jgi:hypothetical protein
MKVVAFLTALAVFNRIIDHLHLTFVAEKPPPKRKVLSLDRNLRAPL